MKKNKITDVLIDKIKRGDKEIEQQNQFLILKTFMEGQTNSQKELSNNVNSNLERMNSTINEIRTEVTNANNVKLLQDEKISEEFKNMFLMIEQNTINWKDAIEEQSNKFNNIIEEIDKKMEWIGKEFVAFARSHCTPDQMKIIQKIVAERIKEMKKRDKTKQFWKNQLVNARETLLKNGINGFIQFLTKILLPIIVGIFLIEAKDILNWIKNLLHNIFK